MTTRKILTQELQDLITESSEEPRSVLIQPNLPPRTINVRAKRVDGQTEEEVQRTNEMIEQTRELLTKTLSAEPKWLAAARAFVVTATGKQLLELAESPLLKHIHLNHVRHIPRSSAVA